MFATQPVAVSDLSLDLSNYRTVPQPDEQSAINAIIAIKPDNFWALMSSLLDRYLPTENIVILDEGGTPNKLIVKEGNRRIAALKLILGIYPLTAFDIPTELVTSINSLTAAWRLTNSTVPCAIYPLTEAAAVDQIVTLVHGKSEKAGRDQWQAVARARHNRDVQKRSEPALDLLEKYLKNGRNITAAQRELWAGDYPITVLVDAIRRLFSRVGATNSADLSNRYPTAISYRSELESIINDIGLSNIRFEHLRSSKDFATPYGIPLITGTGTTGGTGAGSTGTTGGTGTSTTSTGTSTGTTGTSTGTSTGASGTGTTGTGTTGTGTTGTGTTGTGTSIAPAFGTRDPKAVTQTLKSFKPVGANRQKVVTLRDECLKLKLKDNSLAFCFLLRSMFEISAKAYCHDHATDPNLKTTRSDGKEKSLADLLKAITKHLSYDASGAVILPMQRKLHGAMTEIAKTEGILSVTSMNQLVHNPNFSLTVGDVCITFGNIYPLLEAMN